MEELKTDNRTGARYYIKKDPAAGTDFICLNVSCTQFFCGGSQKNCLNFKPNFVTGVLIPLLREPDMQTDSYSQWL